MLLVDCAGVVVMSPGPSSGGFLIAVLLSAPALGQAPGGGLVEKSLEPALFDWGALQLVSEQRDTTSLAARAHARLAVDLDAVVGPSDDMAFVGGAVASWLATLRSQPWARFTVGAVVPFSFDFQAALACLDRCAGYAGRPFGELGNVALFGTWEARPGRNTRLPLGLLIAFPTSPSAAPVGGGFTGERGWPVLPRGLRDLEFFAPGFLAIVPMAGLSQRLGRVEVSVSQKLPVLVSVRPGGRGASAVLGSVVAFDAVVSAQVMIKVVDRRDTTVSFGLRTVGGLVTRQTWNLVRPTSGLGVGLSPPFVSVALEPRGEALFGALAVRAAVIIPVASGSGDEPRFFPAAWGVRVGVGYRFEAVAQSMKK
jgi:hypothetical protein